MTTRLELENKGLGRRETLLDVGDTAGVYKTSFGEVRLDFLFVREGIFSGYRRKGTDIVFDFRGAKALADKVGSQRRISVGENNGRGSQQIGEGITLFLSTQHKSSLI